MINLGFMGNVIMFFPSIGVRYISTRVIPRRNSTRFLSHIFNLIDDCSHECPCQSEVIWQSSGM